MLIESCGYDVSPRGAMLYSIRLAEPERSRGRRLLPLRRKGCWSVTLPFVLPRAWQLRRPAAQPGRARRQAHPCVLLAGSRRDRRALLAGLMDTDGTVVKGVGSCQFAVTNQRLADDVYELVVSLGYKCGRTTQASAGPLRGDLDVLHPQLLDDRRRLPAPPQAPAPQGGASRHDPTHRSTLRHVRDQGSERSRADVSRSTTTTISTSPVRP